MTSAIVVDDDFDTVEVFSEFLSLRDIDIVGKAYDGLEGLKLFEEKHPDIVFSDIWMPNYDGFYLLENLKKNHPESKIIMITADLTQKTFEKLKKLNADSILFKPFEIDNVMNAISKVTNEQKKTISNVNFIE
ncbi:MAG: response regulator [Thaumarchaeota archaeon]|nr:response regulator [Nitrososphaerota archaeon]